MGKSRQFCSLQVYINNFCCFNSPWLLNSQTWLLSLKAKWAMLFEMLPITVQPTLILCSFDKHIYFGVIPFPGGLWYYEVPDFTLTTVFRSYKKTHLSKNKVIWKSFVASSSLFQRNFKSNSPFLSKVPFTFNQLFGWLVSSYLLGRSW